MLTEPNHPSCPRGKLIAQTFCDIHLIEHYGIGIRRIERECAKNGNGMPKREQKCGCFVTTYHPMETGQTSSNAIAPSDGATNGAAKLPDVQQRIVDTIKACPGINAVKLATELDLGTSTIDRGVRYLKNLNLIEFRGSRKTGRMIANDFEKFKNVDVGFDDCYDQTPAVLTANGRRNGLPMARRSCANLPREG